MAAQEWYLDRTGKRLHWPVDDYRNESARHTQWIVEGVIKYHRTVATYVNGLIDSGFSVNRLLEPFPSVEMLAQKPEWEDECRRPTFMLIAAEKDPLRS
jgi:hypothetical protein